MYELEWIEEREKHACVYDNDNEQKKKRESTTLSPTPYIILYLFTCDA